MKIRRTIAIVAGAAALGVASLAFTVVLPVGAQDEPPEQESAAPEERCRRPRPVVRAAVRIAAETIGIEPAELRSALRDGQSVADVAEAHSVDPQSVVDALVATATDRAEDFVNRRFGD
ncbi:MAG: hypothetical protein ACRD0U_03510 [Acidimicrobiales bacterium]